MQIDHHKLKVSRTAHYYTFGELSASTRYFWIACHGYAHSARQLLDTLSFLDPKKHFIVAPQGLSSFYKEGFDGETVSSWMTSEHRLDEITDYTRYIQSIYEQYSPELPPDARILLFGYSQGASTIYRWITNRFPYFHHFINWAGWVPEDIEYTDCLEYLNSKKTSFIYGLEDPFLYQERVNTLQQFVREQKLNLRFYHFDGRHRIDPAFLKTFLAKRISVSGSRRPLQ